jgi:hypothetical protein
MGGDEALLAIDADLVEQDVPAVAQQLLVAQVYFGFQRSAPDVSFQLSAFNSGGVMSMQDARNASGRLNEPARSPTADS